MPLTAIFTRKKNPQKGSARRKAPAQRSRLPRLLNAAARTALFLGLCSLSLVMLYFVGNYQQFLDANQMLILFWCSVSGALAAAAAACLLVCYLAYSIFARRVPGFWFSAACVLLILAGTGILLLSRTLSFASGGNF